MQQTGQSSVRGFPLGTRLLAASAVHFVSHVVRVRFPPCEKESRNLAAQSYEMALTVPHLSGSSGMVIEHSGPKKRFRWRRIGVTIERPVGISKLMLMLMTNMSGYKKVYLCSAISPRLLIVSLFASPLNYEPRHARSPEQPLSSFISHLSQPKLTQRIVRLRSEASGLLVLREGEGDGV